MIKGLKIIDIKRIPTEDKGNLQFFEGNRDIDFEIKRIYYISEVPKGVWRGGHAHKRLKQMLFCPYGKVQVKIVDGFNEEIIVLDTPSKALVISAPLCRDIYWEIDSSVLCVAASDYYDEKDYIRDYEEYLKYISSR